MNCNLGFLCVNFISIPKSHTMQLLNYSSNERIMSSVHIILENKTFLLIKNYHENWIKGKKIPIPILL